MNKKILLIDDNEHIVEAVTLILTTEDYDVISFTEIKDIIKEVKKIKPDLILLDLLLSGGNGKDATTLLKNDKATGNIPIIIISAHPSAKTAAMEAKADAFLAKPFDIAVLLALVEKYTSPTH